MTEYWNWIDLLEKASFWFFFVDLQFFHSETIIDREKQGLYKKILEFFIIFLMLLKLNFFLRIFSKFGLLVNLIITCFKDIVPFTVYLAIWLLTFVMLFKTIGIKFPEQKFFKEGSFLGMFFYVWNNSIGNIDYPDEKSFVNMPVIQEIIVWSIYWTNQFVVVIILLNFLIAVISQSYENVMNSKTIKKYKDIAHLNKEAYLILSMVGLVSKSKLVKNNRILLSIKVNENTTTETEEWAGFATTMKNFFKKNL